MSQFLSNKICLYVIIKVTLLFPRSIVRCFMWTFCSSRTKISIYFHREWYFYITKYLSNGILNVKDIIWSKYCFKVIYFPHRYYNTYNFNIGFTNNFIVEKLSFTCTFFIFSSFLSNSFLASANKTKFIWKDVSISTNENFNN